MSKMGQHFIDLIEKGKVIEDHNGELIMNDKKLHSAEFIRNGRVNLNQNRRVKKLNQRVLQKTLKLAKKQKPQTIPFLTLHIQHCKLEEFQVVLLEMLLLINVKWIGN